MDHDRVKALLADAITVLCKSGIQYKTKFTIQGLLGITVDDEDVFLVDIHEKVGDTRLPTGMGDRHACQATGGRFLGAKRRRERKLFRPKRKRPESDILRTPSPSFESDLSHGHGQVQDQSESALMGIGENSEGGGQEGRRKETSSCTTATADTCSLEMTVDQISQWPREKELSSRINVNPDGILDVQGVESTVAQDSTVSQNLPVKSEENIVHVKQEKSDVLPATGEPQARTQMDSETFPRGPSQDLVIDSQSKFTLPSQGQFQHPESFPTASDLRLTPHTDGSSGSETELFQAGDQTKTSGDMSTHADQAQMRQDDTRALLKRKTETVTRPTFQPVKKTCTKIQGNIHRRDDDRYRADQRELFKAPRRFLNSCRTRHIAARAAANAKTRSDIRLQNDIKKILNLLEQRNMTDPLNVTHRLFDTGVSQYSHVNPSDLSEVSNLNVLGEASHLGASVSDTTSGDLRVHIPSFVPDIGPFITEKMADNNYGLTPETTRRLFASAKSITHFAVLLSRKVFTDEDLENANIRGWGGKRKLDTGKVNTIRNEVFNWYMTSSYNQEEVWNREIIKAIDKDNRKRRSTPKVL